MVAETKETMNKMFDCWNESFQTMFDAGRRAQESWTKTVAEASKNPANPTGFENFFNTGEKVAREFAPFVGKNMETFAKSCDTAFRTGMDVFKSATEVASHPEDGDLYQKSRKVFDVAFDAFRTNMEAFNKAATRNSELCSAFYQAVCTCPESGKSTPKTAKA